MQLDWTTFVLEVVNFLVLVWILKRFLYRPVLDVLDARQARVREQTQRAEKLRQEAAALKQQFEERLANWSQERDESRRHLEEELARQRAAGVERIRRSLADEEARARAREAAKTAPREAELVRQAASHAYGHASAMLARLASPALTASIAQLVVADLAALPAGERETLVQAAARLGDGEAAELASAHPLDEATVGGIAKALSAAAGRALRVSTRPEPTLIAGVRVAVGECLLHANLADELAFFRRRDGHA
jgi:F-type H+-transporting ATPase subunit b